MSKGFQGLLKKRDCPGVLCTLERHFEPVNIDEQKLNRVIYQENTRGGMDTRNVLKDNYKQCTKKNIKDQDNIILKYGQL